MQHSFGTELKENSKPVENIGICPFQHPKWSIIPTSQLSRNGAIIPVLLLKVNSFNLRISKALLRLRSFQLVSGVQLTRSHGKLRDNCPRSLMSSGRENQIQRSHTLINVFISRTPRKKMLGNMLVLKCIYYFQYNKHSPSKNPRAQMKINDTYQ